MHSAQLDVVVLLGGTTPLPMTQEHQKATRSLHSLSVSKIRMSGSRAQDPPHLVSGASRVREYRTLPIAVSDGVAPRDSTPKLCKENCWLIWPTAALRLGQADPADTNYA